MRNVQKVGLKPLSSVLSQITRDYIYLPMHGVTYGDDSLTALTDRTRSESLSWTLANQTVDTPNANTYSATPGMVKPDGTHMVTLGDPNTTALLQRIFDQSVVAADDGITVVGFGLKTHGTAPTSAEEILDSPTAFGGNGGLFGIQMLNSSTNPTVRMTWKNTGGSAIFTPSKTLALTTEYSIVVVADHYNGLLRIFTNGDYAAPTDVSMPTDGTGAPGFISTGRVSLFGRKTGVSAASNLFNAGTSTSADAALHDFFACRVAGSDATIVADIVKEANAARYELPARALAR